MGSIIKRGSVFQAKIRRKGLPIIAGTFDSVKEAKEWLSQTENKVKKGQYVQEQQPEKTTLYELIEQYKCQRLPQLKNEEKDSIMLSRLQRDPMARLTLDCLSPSVLVQFRDKRLAQGLANSSVVRDLAQISAVINYGRKDLLIEMSNPVSGIRRPRLGKGRDRRLSAEEQERLLYELKSHSLEDDRDDGKKYRSGCLNEWILPIVKFAIATAMRKSEILKLKWADVDLEKRVALLFDTKNGTDRGVPLSSAAVQILRSLPKEEEGDNTDYVFKTTSEAVKKAFERARKRAMLDDLRFHDLRHEATSRIANKLPNVVELSSVTGHKSLAMLQRYYHPRAEDLALKLG